MNKEWQDAKRQNDIVKVRLLLDNGVDINSKDKHGQTALMNASHTGQVELVRLLIEKGAELNATAKYNLSALMLSIIGHHAEIAQILIEAGADLNTRSNKHFMEKTALTLAEDSSQSQIVALLRQMGATK
jgi:uncharacterized protein